MRKQNPSSVSGEQSAKTRASAHASQEITPLHAAADARAANNYNFLHCCCQQKQTTAATWLTRVTARIILVAADTLKSMSLMQVNSVDVDCYDDGAFDGDYDETSETDAPGNHPVGDSYDRCRTS